LKEKEDRKKFDPLLLIPTLEPNLILSQKPRQFFYAKPCRHRWPDPRMDCISPAPENRLFTFNIRRRKIWMAVRYPLAALAHPVILSGKKPGGKKTNYGKQKDD
jgi:hypothetical protein